MSTGDHCLHTCIVPSKGGPPLFGLKELYRYGDLLYFLLRRDISIKYKQAFLGFAWAVLVPFVNMVIFGKIFGRFAKMPTDGLNPYLFYFSGLIPWQLFSRALSVSGLSVVNNVSLITHVYFPRLIIPLAGCLTPVLDFLFAFSMLILLSFYFDVGISFGILLIPFFVLLTLMSAFGFGLIIAPLNVKYRDIKFVLPFLTQIWMFATVLLPFSAIPEKARILYALNPMAGVVEGIRLALFYPIMPADSVALLWSLILPGAAVSSTVLLLGLYYFRRMEKTFADIV